MPDTLGNSTSRTLIELTDLILKETDKEKKKALRKQHRELAKALRKLIDKTVETDTAKYRRAKDALDKACDAIREAKEGHRESRSDYQEDRDRAPSS